MITWIIVAVSLGLLLAGAVKTNQATKHYQFSWTGALLMIAGLAGIFIAAASLLW